MTDWGWGDEMGGTRYMVRAWEVPYDTGPAPKWFYADLLEAAACFDRACEEYPRAYLKDLVTDWIIKRHSEENHDTPHQP